MMAKKKLYPEAIAFAASLDELTTLADAPTRSLRRAQEIIGRVRETMGKALAVGVPGVVARLQVVAMDVSGALIMQLESPTETPDDVAIGDAIDALIAEASGDVPALLQPEARALGKTVSDRSKLRARLSTAVRALLKPRFTRRLQAVPAEDPLALLNLIWTDILHCSEPFSHDSCRLRAGELLDVLDILSLEAAIRDAQYEEATTWLVLRQA
jgi:hypothetical protein